MTVNNLPIVFTIAVDDFSGQIKVTYKYAVPPLKDLTTACINYVLTRRQA